ncbi:ClpP/crotonase-like domain-containing protein [Entophlyctis helioformis]|nr:ClpP/crotonase-like domain-containing protein [Entophlyctis helioformis]
MSGLPTFQTLTLAMHKDHVLIMTFNRPEVYNALSPLSYDEWLAALQYAARTDAVRVVVHTGAGPFFSSGQQLALPPAEEMGDLRGYFVRRCAVTGALVELLIDFPKLLMVAVNGPAFGFGVTTLALADLVYSVPHATFKTPFMELSLCVEACSTVTFPRALGNAKAKEMLFLGRTMTAKEFEQAGLIAEIFPADTLMAKVLEKAEQAAAYSPTAVQESLKLVKMVDREVLRKMNKLELELLVERCLSDDFTSAIAAFFSRQKKPSKKSKSKL